jgi:hypothetical protein
MGSRRSLILLQSGAHFWRPFSREIFQLFKSFSSILIRDFESNSDRIQLLVGYTPLAHLPQGFLIHSPRKFSRKMIHFLNIFSCWSLEFSWAKAAAAEAPAAMRKKLQNLFFMRFFKK